jgi:hypothetical protein
VAETRYRIVGQHSLFAIRLTSVPLDGVGCSPLTDTPSCGGESPPETLARRGGTEYGGTVLFGAPGSRRAVPIAGSHPKHVNSALSIGMNQAWSRPAPRCSRSRHTRGRA